MSNNSYYCIILCQQDDFDSTRLADILSRILNIPRLDVITYLKNHWGILHRTLEIDKAKELQQKLKNEGIETSVLSTSDSELKVSPPSKVLTRAIPESKGLVFKERKLDALLTWSNSILLCAGQVEQTGTTKETLPPDGKAAKWIARTGLTPITAIAISAERSKRREVTKEETNLEYYLDIIAKDNSESVRILGNSFDYSYLEERKGYNVFHNFKNLILDISKFLPHVIKNQGVNALINVAYMRNFRYRSLLEYEREKLWLMQLAMLKIKSQDFQQ